MPISTARELHTRFDLVKQCYIAILLRRAGCEHMCYDMQIFDVRNLLIKCRQLMEVRRKETKGMDLRCNMPKTYTLC